MDKLPPNSFCDTAIKEDKRSSGSSNVAEKAAIDEIWPLLFLQYEQLQKIYLEKNSQYVLLWAVIKNYLPSCRIA